MVSKEKNKVGRLMLSNFKTYYEAVITETCGSGENRQTDQRNGFERPERDPPKCSQLIVDKRTKAVQ